MPFKGYVGHFTLRPPELIAARQICRQDKRSLSGLARLLLVRHLITGGFLPPDHPLPISYNRLPRTPKIKRLRKASNIYRSSHKKDSLTRP